MANPGADAKGKVVSRERQCPVTDILKRLLPPMPNGARSILRSKRSMMKSKPLRSQRFPGVRRREADGQLSWQAREAAVATSASPVPVLPLTSIRFPQHEEVDVSIIIPVFNQLEYTHACLASLQAVEEQTRFEVIIVDDCSTDAPQRSFRKLTESFISATREIPGSSLPATGCGKGARQIPGLPK